MQVFKNHSSAINQIDVDSSGEFMVTAGEDGIAVIHNLYSSEKLIHIFKNPIFGILFEPDYAKNSAKRYICGEKNANVSLNGKGWFGSTQAIIAQSLNNKSDISTKDSYFSWADDKTVYVYEIDALNVLLMGKVEFGESELSRCNISWHGKQILLGWGHCIKVIDIIARKKEEVLPGFSTKTLTVTQEFKTTYFICGISTFRENLLILGLDKSNLDKFLSINLYISNRSGLILETESLPCMESTMLSVDSFRLFSSDYHLTEQAYYIVSSQEIILAKGRDLNDHLEWLIKMKSFGKAYHELINATDKVERTLALQVGLEYMDNLIQMGSYDKAGEICGKVLQIDSILWAKYSHIFSQAKKLHCLVKYVPAKDGVLDSEEIYHFIINSLAMDDHECLLSTIRQWSPLIYSVTALLEILQPELDKSNASNIILQLGMEL